MEIDPELIIRFVHDTIKPIRTMHEKMRMEEDSGEATQPADDAVHKTWMRSFAAVRQALDDLQTVAEIAKTDKTYWENLNWNKTVEEHLASLQKDFKSLDSHLSQKSLVSQCDPDLIRHALLNMAVFSKGFSNKLLSINLNEVNYDGQAMAVVTYVLNTILDLGAEFEQVKCFTPILKESMTIVHNSGLILYAVKLIMECHGGSLNIRCQGKQAKIDLLCPLAGAA